MSRSTSHSAGGFSFVELLMGAFVLVLVFGFLGIWFHSNRRSQTSISEVSRTQELFRSAMWKMIAELKTGRIVIWPQVNSDKSPRTDSVLVFKNFRGEFVSFYFIPQTQEVRRCVIPNGVGAAVEDPAPIVQGLASATFTVMGVDNKLVSINLSGRNMQQIDAVRLVNE